MATFETRVENYVGTQSDDFSDNLTDAAKEVLDLVPKARLRFYSTGEADSGTGVSLSGKRLAYATKSGRFAREVPPGLKASITDSNSIHEATTFSPAFYVGNGTCRVEPGGGTVHTVSYPTVSQLDTSISNFPDELEEAVVVLAAIKWLNEQDDFEKVQSLQATYKRIIQSYLGTSPEE